MIPDNEAAIIATFIQAILYGSYLISLAFCLRWLVYEDEGWTVRKKINWPMLSITSLVFLFLTTNLGTSLWMTITVNVFAIDDNLQLVVQQLNVANGVIETVTILLMDAVLIYRCFVVYASSWLFISPLLVLWFGDLVCAVLGIAVLAVVDLGLTTNPVWMARLPHIWAAFYSCNIATTVYATGAIIYRIFSVAKGSPSNSERFYRTCRILAESGILYALSSALILVARVLDSDPQFDLLGYIADAVNFSMTGITFNLVLIRVRKSRAESKDSSHADTKFTKKDKSLSALQFHVATVTSRLTDGQSRGDETDEA